MLLSFRNRKHEAPLQVGNVGGVEMDAEKLLQEHIATPTKRAGFTRFFVEKPFLFTSLTQM